MNFINRIAQRFFRKSFLPLAAYILLILLVIPQSTQLYVKAIFVFYALFIFWIIWWHAWDSHGQEEGRHAKFFRYLLIGSVIFFVITRLFLFVRYGQAPLGYDTGFYLKTFDTIFEEGIGGHRSTRTLLWAPFIWLGVPRVYILHGLYVFFQFLIVGSLYALARKMAFSSRLPYAAVLLFLFAISLPQFFAFWWMFYQMELAIAFLLMTLALIHRHSPFAIVTAGFVAAIHPATFLPLGVTLAIFVFIQLIRALFWGKRLERESVLIIVIGVAMLVVIQQFAREFVQIYLRGSVNAYGWFLTNYPVHIKQQFTGLYIGFDLFRLANTYILPFSFIGVLLLVFKKLPQKRGTGLSSRLLFFLIFLTILLILSYFPFIYRNRFLIILDLVLILFAAYSFVYLFNYFLGSKRMRLALVLLVLGLGIYAVYPIWKQEPQLYPDELAELKALSQRVDPSDYVMSTESLYTPWVYAFANGTTIDPGYLQFNKWTYDMWVEFWYGKSDARRHELLRLYEKPIFIFIGKKVPAGIAYRRFIVNSPYFVKISEHVWYYDPRNITEDEISVMRGSER